MRRPHVTDTLRIEFNIMLAVMFRFTQTTYDQVFFFQI